MGFRAFFDRTAMGLKEAGWGAPDHDVFDFVLGSAGEETGLYFYYVITMSSHTPFTLIDSYYQDARYDNIKDPRVRSYFASISYVDRELARFIRALQSLPNAPWIVVFGDHTPSVDVPEFSDSRYDLSGRSVELVPLWIVAPPGVTIEPGSRKLLASQLDVAPTVLSIAGVGANYRTWGTDLLQIRDDQTTTIPFLGVELPRGGNHYQGIYSDLPKD